MVLLSELSFSLPLKNPVLIFSLILFIILFAPLLLNKLKIPHLIGLIIAGAIIGPHGLTLLERGDSFELFGMVGLLYIMFLAGLEIDMTQFRKNSGKSLIFGLYTFIIPMGIGTAAGYYVLQFSLPTSVLLASMFASHTLITYPLISKLGVAKNRAVTITVGGTMITDTLALLVLAVVVGMATGEVTDAFWYRLGISVAIFSLLVMLGFPALARWFFKRFDDNILQYIFVLALVFMGGFLAEAAGIEAIIGAFLAGLALNGLIPHSSPLMNRIEFVGNALFIPFFLIGVGMLINFRAFFNDWMTIWVAVVMIVCAISGKWVASWLTQKSFGYSNDERRLIFGLSNAQAAATLAAVLVGYKVIVGQDANGEEIRLLNENVLNGTILMILVTCTMASVVAQRGAMALAAALDSGKVKEDKEIEERILLAVSNLETAEELAKLGIIVKSKGNTKGMYAAHIIDSASQNEQSEKEAGKILQKATEVAAATDNHMNEIIRYDLNVVNGITSVVKEKKVTDVILGLTSHKGFSNSFVSNLTNGILTKVKTTTYVYKPAQPLATIKRHLIIVPPRAEQEIGFAHWLVKVWNIARNTGAALKFYAHPDTIGILEKFQKRHPVNADFKPFQDWDDLLILFGEVAGNDNLIVVMSRKNHPSYQQGMTKVHGYLNKYLRDTNYILIYPVQAGIGIDDLRNYKDPTFLAPIEQLDDLGKTMSRLLKRKKDQVPNDNGGFDSTDDDVQIDLPKQK